jgi:hypothetical protein
MRTLLVAVGAAAVLSGCATPQEKAARAQAEMEQMMQVYGPACSKLGYPAASDQWRNCVLQLSAKEDYQRYNTSYYAGYGRRHWSFGGFWGPW